MTPSPTTPLPAPASPRWRSLEEHADPAAWRARLEREFPEGATEWPSDVSRRQFLKISGASLVLAGLAGCGGDVAERIVPRVSAPEEAPPGHPLFYATAMPIEGFARGILVEAHEGRPTKIEGNPDHPESLGATDAVTQAAVLSLYDPARSRTPRQGGATATWPEFEEAWLGRRAKLAPARGAGLAILTEPTTSPTLRREIHALLEAWPEAKWFQHTALARHDRDGRQPDYDFGAVDVVFAIESDFLFQHPAALRHARAFTRRRRIEHGHIDPNRLFVLESSPTITGSMADARLPVSPARLRRLLGAIARHLDDGNTEDAELSGEERRFVAVLAAALKSAGARALCVAGPEQPPEIHAWADALNRWLGTTAVRSLPAIRSDADPRCAGTLADLVRAIDGGQIETLVMLGVNPVYTAPRDVAIADALGRVEFTVHVGGEVDETAVRCRWHLPESHFLEAWSDLRAYDGTATIQQPLIRPRHASRSVIEIVRFLRDPAGVPGYDLVRATWQEGRDPVAFEDEWHGWLNTGVVADTAASPLAAATQGRPSWPDLGSGEDVKEPMISLRPSPHLHDGRWANNPWLQELPAPFSHVVWDNAALISPADATRLHLVNGSVIACEHGGARVEAPVWLTPGQADGVITLTLGYGRAHTGEIGQGVGYDAYPLRTTRDPWTLAGATITAVRRFHVLVSTQGHFAMEGRDIVRDYAPAEVAKLEGRKEPLPSLYPDTARDRHAWGMSIDIGTCIGCQACVTACQAENNIPSVGKDQVLRGREMLWLRVDRYFDGEPANPRFFHQPVPCMQCEHAPCEVVCPVAATVHSSEGLNDMLYNRCVGTRYCSNNCPYKVRRFNFLDYRQPAGSPLHLQENPDVTVRARGVMEKCTYCVQRINAGRIRAERENRPLRDGEIQTACQQACPVEAIVFGDLNDPQSRVRQRKSEPTAYALLEDLNTRPRTTYLARVQHRAPARGEGGA